MRTEAGDPTTRAVGGNGQTPAAASATGPAKTQALRGKPGRIDALVHAELGGRPYMANGFERMIRYVRQHEDIVWFPTRDEVVDYLTDYARELPVELNRRVTAVHADGDGCRVELGDRTLRAHHVVVATGPFQVPRVPGNPLTIDHFTGAIGLPMPSTDIAIRDDDGRDLKIGEAGELCIQGPQVMAGYALFLNDRLRGAVFQGKAAGLARVGLHDLSLSR